VPVHRAPGAGAHGKNQSLQRLGGVLRCRLWGENSLQRAWLVETKYLIVPNTTWSIITTA